MNTTPASRLLYVVGPSGAGKDSLLDWLRAHLPEARALHWARRTISRPATADGEQYESVSPETFDTLMAQGAFGMDWTANGLRYGIRHAELAPLQQGQWVVVNGSREHLPRALALHSSLVAVHITASAATLRSRLARRGRETEAQISARIARASAFAMPPGSTTIEVHNDHTLAQAGEHLASQLRSLAGWPEHATAAPQASTF